MQSSEMMYLLVEQLRSRAESLVAKFEEGEKHSTFARKGTLIGQCL